MVRSISRRRLIALGSAGVTSVALAGRASRVSAQSTFNYKLAHGQPLDSPFHKRVTELFEAVKRETNGRLDVQIFGNSSLGSETAALAQMRSGAIQFMSTASGLGNVVPEVSLPQVGFAYTSPRQALAAYDGEVGGYIRAAMAKRNIYGFKHVWDIGFRQLTSGTRQLRKPEDLEGFKLRTPNEKISLELFQAFGASPTPMTFDQLYTALQTHLVDGQESPLITIELAKLYEVQKYLSITNHQFTAFWLVANVDAFNALPPDIRTSVTKNAEKYTLLQRRDIAELNSQVAGTLQKQGLSFTTLDVGPMRKRLAKYYARFKADFGPAAWEMLEKSARTALN